MSGDQKPVEKGNVARIVNRLSKDFGAGGSTGSSSSISSVLTDRTENVPSRSRAWSTISTGSTATFPRNIDTGNKDKDKHQQQENSAEDDGGGKTPVPLSTSAPKTTGNLLKNFAQQTKIKDYAKVLYKYDAAAPDELSLPEGAIVSVISRRCEDDGWFVAEHGDGRRGLFPDNFVKFLPPALTQPTAFQHTLGSPRAPPSLPSKPLKLGGAPLHQIQPPVASARDSIVNSNSSSANSPAAATAKPPTAATMDNLTSTCGDSTPTADADTENTNNSGSASGGGDSATSLHEEKPLNTVGSRCSLKIRNIREALEKTGGIRVDQHQRPASLSVKEEKTLSAKEEKETPKDAAIQDAIKSESTSNAEPSPKSQLLVGDHVKARVQIEKPPNRRPPSKVNSAALLAADSSERDSSGSAQKAPLESISEEQQHGKGVQHKSTAVFQYPPVLPSTSVQHHHHHNVKPFSPSASSNASGATDRTFGTPSLSIPPSVASSSYQWVNQVDFKQYTEETNRRFAEMQAEIAELRARVDNAQNKVYALLRKWAIPHVRPAPKIPSWKKSPASFIGTRK